MAGERRSTDSSSEDLSHDLKGTPLLGERKTLEAGARNSKTRRFAWRFHLFAFASYTLFFVIASLFASNARCGVTSSSSPYSPAKDAIAVETRVVDGNFTGTSVYKGKPSKELDEAWDTLLTNTHVRVSSEELRNMNQHSVALSDAEGGYLAALDVHHQLHCLKFLRRAVYADSYGQPPNMLLHVDHCVDIIRQSLMCGVNPSLFTYEWHPNQRGPVPVFQVARQCMDWGRLDAWAASRKVDIYDTVAVVHPVLGPSFPGGADAVNEALGHGGRQ